MKTVDKVYKTQDNTILIVKATTGIKGNRYVSVTASEVEPLLYSDAVIRTRESLEDGDLWKDAVQSGNTTLGLDAWIEYVIDNDGETSMIDNSLYTEELDIDGDNYIFDSISCGCLHDHIAKVTDEFKRLIELHLSSKVEDIEEADRIIEGMKDEDVDAQVDKFTREIILE